MNCQNCGKELTNDEVLQLCDKCMDEFMGKDLMNIKDED